MGASQSTQKLVSNVTDFVTGQKRKYPESNDEKKKIETAMNTPKKKKLESTAQYVYQALYKEGKNSDITVRALGEDFHLHKIYLCQSAYFASMFGGNWLETTKKGIYIDVVDPLITVDSLRVVFGSLYKDEVTLNPAEIVPILATATMFQLDGIIEKCTEVMLETINPKTALEYYEASCRYGDQKLKGACIKWFLVNLMTYYYQLLNLQTIPVDFMTELLSSPDLFVMQTEFSIYVMLKYWMYILVHSPVDKPCVEDLNTYYGSREGQPALLLTKEGSKYAPAFKALRLHNLISHYTDVEIILKDNIIPKSWLNPVFVQQWKVMLRINQNKDTWPNKIPDDVFLANSLRCGRILTAKEKHIWRWTGFHYGLDLLMIADGKKISIKRNHRPEFEQLLSLQTIRNIAIRVTAVTLNEQRQITYTQTSDIQNLPLMKGEEAVLLTFERDLTFPLIISANILLTLPDTSEVKMEKIENQVIS